MTRIRYAEITDKAFWFRLDAHLPETEFEEKVRLKRGYVLLSDGKPIALLRYNLFWDEIPFCTMLFVDKNDRGKGFGKQLSDYWESDMKAQGYDVLLTSSRADESAQHFYRKAGYRDCGAFVFNVPKYSQPTEIVMIKPIP